MKRGSRKVSSFCFWWIHEKPCKDAPCKVLGLRRNPSLSFNISLFPQIICIYHFFFVSLQAKIIKW
jgi:hypothetical protein